MAEQEAVNFKAVGSSPAGGASNKNNLKREYGEKTMFKDTVIVILCLVLLIVAFGGIMLALDHKTCDEQTKYIELPHTWSIWTSCMVSQDGKWMPLSSWRYVGNLP
jgi:hypothetical protein